mgnify:CR=1 FL=1
MVLDQATINSVQQYISLLEGPIVFNVSAGDDTISSEMLGMLNQVKQLSNLISIEKTQLERTPSFGISRPNSKPRVFFAGIPGGHEFTSFIMAMLQVSGRKPKVSDSVIDQIKELRGSYKFETYISLTCHNCPEVVQALNMMSALNPNITHTMIDGGVFQDEVKAKDIMAVPAMYLNGEFSGSGRMTVEEILAKLGSKADVSSIDGKEYDVLIVGGGPAGASAAVYAARKGIKVGLVAERFGGQVMDTMGIENLIGTKYTEGPKLVAQLEEHVKEYNVDIINLERAKSVSKTDKIEVVLETGAKLNSKTLIISTGARWRNLGVPGEAEFKNKGVAYCPHCDGPLFKGKHVAVIGGGNSGVEAAIDLAGIVSHVTLIEFGAELKADKVLQDRLYSLKNTTVIKNAQTKEITGTNVVNGITYIERDTNLEQHIELQGVFIQIGLVPNTDWIGDTLERTRFGEIIVDSHGATDVPGIFAAGDCTNTPYKQIIISMGAGANAALGAFDYLIRN